MRAIGITGGVGAGKSAILSYINRRYNCRILFADQIAHQLEAIGEPCYKQLLALLGSGILQEEGGIDRRKMAGLIFGDDTLRRQVNQIIHPAVKAYVKQELQDERKRGIHDFFFLEAALLIEEHYEEILDELWYISAEEAVRKERLQQSRAYSEERAEQIMKRQLPEEVFRQYCGTIIDNSGKIEEALRQVNEKLGEYL